MKNKKMIKGLKKLILGVTLKLDDDDYLDMRKHAECPIGVSGLWVYCDMDHGHDYKKTAKKLFGIDHDVNILNYNSFCHNHLLSDEELMIAELFDINIERITVKSWRDKAKKVLRELNQK